MRAFYDVIVIGGGHAGAEAAWAAASVLERRGTTANGSGRVALITMDPSKIGAMSCNPAIGGLAKGQMVREIDALGGLMGLAADATGIMFKMLNSSRGAAVRGPRAQCDKYAYAAEVQRLIATRPAIDVIAATIDDLFAEDGRIVGVRIPASAALVHPDPATIEWNLANRGGAHPIYTARAVPSTAATPAQAGPAAASVPAATAVGQSRCLRASAVVLTTGTFMRGLMHTGETRTPGGRIGEGSAVGISGMLRRLGFELGRLKTGTPPRLARESIDWDGLEPQRGDLDPAPFSDIASSPFPRLPQVECRLTHTTVAAHELVRANLHRAPMYCGQIEAECGPRYCPSIEDKVVRFPQRESHHVFLEPESLHTNEIYCNGISTSLPIDVQERLVHSMPGCGGARVLRWGYAVEYDMIWPHQIDSTGQTKLVRGLFTAGQINGTSGYEEAAAQGLVAGLNAARLARGEELIRFGRDEAYIGVMMDDLVTRTPREPYRMFTSRAEFRLLLRADNADLRLTEKGRSLGLVDAARFELFTRRCAALDHVRALFNRVVVDGRPLRELARRPDIALADLLSRLDPRHDARFDPPCAIGPDSTAAGEQECALDPCIVERAAPTAVGERACALDPRIVERISIEAKYDGYIARQQADVRRLAESEHRCIPAWLDPHSVEGLRAEAAEVLARFRPATFGQAGRLAGMTPADLTLLAVAIRRAAASAPARASMSGRP